jgi:hypothetical protein
MFHRINEYFNEKDRDKYNEQFMVVNESLYSSHLLQGVKKREKCFFKLKDEHRIIIFFISKQSFKE